MARKSRKNVTSSMKKEKAANCYFTGFYLRLSDKDSGEGCSESIENQWELLADFIKDKPDFKFVSVFIDDGKTGTNFKRSGFEEMMEAVKQGKINCIIVKDLSRFGRNYLEAGNYIENIFPFLNVRFIAVTDYFDTLTAASSQLAYLVPLKNMMNENYAKDISKKERSAKKMLRKRGYFLGTHAVYGYEKSQNDKHVLVIDEVAAAYVREIFNMCELGYSDSAIAKYLNCNQVACPARYKYEKGFLHHEKYGHTSGWYPQTVAAILVNRAYRGEMVQGKRVCREMKGKKECVPREEWDIVPGTHEPIITHEQFDRVQQIRNTRRKNYMTYIEKKANCAENTANIGIVKGKIFCGDCGKAMLRKRIRACEDYYRYICEGHERNGVCIRKFLRESELMVVLEEVIEKRIEVSCNIEEWILTLNKFIDSKLYKWEQEHKSLEQKINRLCTIKSSLYQEWKEGILDKEEYLRIKTRYKSEIENYKTEQEKIVKKKQEYIINSTLETPAFKSISGLFSNNEVTKDLINTFIERIDVYEQNRIKMILRF